VDSTRRALILAAVIAYLEAKRRRVRPGGLRREAPTNAWRIASFMDISEHDPLASC
jgi:hypothetical protein